MKLKGILFTLVILLIISTACSCGGGSKGEPVDMSEIKMDTAMINSVKSIFDNDTLKYKTTNEDYVLENGSVHFKVLKLEDNYRTFFYFKGEKIELTKREEKEIQSIIDSYVEELEQSKQEKLRSKLSSYAKD